MLAQIAALQGQSATSTSCPSLSRNLSFGSRGSDVVQLQHFLISESLLAAGNNTGYFGKMTEAAVKKYQCKNMNICSGSPSSNGYGAVGPRTRAAIGKTCAAPAQYPTTSCKIQCTTGCVDANTSAVVTCRLGYSQSDACYATTTCERQPSGQCGWTQTAALTQCLTKAGNSAALCAPLAPQTQTLACPSGQTGAQVQQRTSSCPGPTWSTWATISNTCSTASCTPLPAQTQTLSCPTGQTGSITQTRVSSCPGPTWSGWTTTSNTCSTTPPPQKKYLLKQALIFSIDQDFGNVTDNPEFLNGDFRILQRFIDTVRPFQSKHEVYVHLTALKINTGKLDPILDFLKQNDIPFLLDVYTSDIHANGAVVYPNTYDVRHGRSMSIDQLKTYKAKYGASFAGLRTHEVFGQNMTVLACQQLGVHWCDMFINYLPTDNFYQKKFLEEYVKFAKDNGMFVFFDDNAWSADAPPSLSELAHMPQNEQELRDLVAAYPDTVVVAWGNEVGGESARSKIDTWQSVVQPYVQSGAKGFGLGNESWMCADETSCPSSELASWAAKAFAKGALVVQFEPFFYWFQLPHGAGSASWPDLTDPQWANRGYAAATLTDLANALGVSISPPPILDLAVHIAPNPGTAWRVVGSGDFNADGKSDLVWQSIDGSVGIWFMNGTAAGDSLTLPINPGPTWHLIALADFNGDGKPDLLWQSDDETASVWFMNGTTVGTSATLTPNPGSTWRLVGAADFNADGKPDLLLQDTSGRVDVWFMNGVSVLSTATIATVPTKYWRLVGTADMNADGKPDLLWQSAGGYPAVWFMNGTSVESSVYLSPTTLKLRGTGDFNGDGKPDLLWQNVDGEADIWLMNGTAVLH